MSSFYYYPNKLHIVKGRFAKYRRVYIIWSLIFYKVSITITITQLMQLYKNSREREKEYIAM